MIVAKFGGTSVGTSAAILATAEIVRERVPHGLIVVVSAMSGVTTELLALADQAKAGQLLDALGTLRRVRARHLDAARSLLDEAKDPGPLRDVTASISALCDELAHLLEALSVLGHLTPRALDAIAATGELLSMELVTGAYVARGIPAVAVDPRRVMITDAAFMQAQPLPDSIGAATREWLLPLVAAGQVPVIGGFVGATADGVTTTLGRGGSDYSAALLGAAADATAIEIWTDVDGMLTADPRIVSDAQLIEHIRFDEASELATFGAKVLHPSTIAPAVTRGIPVYIFNTRRPQGRGTRIDAAAPRRSLVALAGKGPITMLKIRSPHMLLAPGFLRRLYEIFEQHRTSVDVVATSEISVTVTVDRLADARGDTDGISALAADLEALGEVIVEPSQGVVALVGSGLGDDVATIARALVALRGIRIQMLSLSATRLNLTIVVDSADVPTAIRLLHAEFFPSSGIGGSAPSEIDQTPMRRRLESIA